MQKGMSRSVSRVLSWMIICLGRALLHGSSHPSGTDGQPMCPRSRCCSRWGLQSAPCHQGTGELLPRLSTLTAIVRRRRRRFISVALSLKSPSPGVSRHPCPMEPGLSSFTAFQPCDRDHPTCSCPSNDTGFTASCKYPFPPPSGLEDQGRKPKAVRPAPRRIRAP